MTNTDIVILVVLVAIAAILLSGNSTLMLIGGIISIIGLYSVFSSNGETNLAQATGKVIVTTMNSREVKSNGDIITSEEKIETSSNPNNAYVA